MKTRSLIYKFLAATLLLGFAACKKQVQVDPPTTLISSATVFSNDNTAISAQLSLYAQMADDPYNYHVTTALSSDEYTSYSTNPNSVDIYKNALTAQGTDAANIGIWSQTYNYLYRVNAVLEGIASSTGLSNKVKQQTKGEALLMRAYFDFYLTNFYGDVPIVNNTDYKVNSALSRSPQSDIYQQVINDLRQSQNLLSANYLDATDMAVSPDHIRPTKWAATALLARAYLYNKNWIGADSAASVLINNPTYQLSPLTGATGVFMKNSSEAIWQVTPNLTFSQYATTDGRNFILTAAPNGVSNLGIISPQLLSAFESNDQRKVNWVGSFTDGITTWYFPYKYKDGKSATALHEYTMILRLGEQYLIRAEARVMEGNNLSGALADLNAIRTRAGLPNYNGATDKTSVMAAILHERQVELFCEGHRWSDLRRTGSLDALMGSPGNVTLAKGGVTWNSYQQYYPIPQSDINISPNLAQTPGY